ncbi:MAG: TetR/AcrR family transcriptional regulator [Flexilinea sp.]
MNENKVDRRVKYTRMVLRQSLLELMKEQPINKITTTDICKHADINRNTFYTHYSSPDDLLTQIENELFAEIKQSVERSLKAEMISSLLLEIFQAITENGDLCKILFSEFGDKVFLKRIMYIAHDRCLTEWSAMAPGVAISQLEMAYTFTANGCVGIIESWIQGGLTENPQEIAHFIDKMSSNGLQIFLHER